MLLPLRSPDRESTARAERNDFSAHQGVSRFRFHSGWSCQGRVPISVSSEAPNTTCGRRPRSTSTIPTETEVPGCWKENTSLKNDVYLLPKGLDGQVETLIPVLGAMIAVFAQRRADSTVYDVAAVSSSGARVFVAESGPKVSGRRV